MQKNQKKRNYLFFKISKFLQVTILWQHTRSATLHVVLSVSTQKTNHM